MSDTVDRRGTDQSFDDLVERAARGQHEAERAAYVASGETTHLPWDAADWPESECEEGWTKEQWLDFMREGLIAAGVPQMLEEREANHELLALFRDERHRLTEALADALLGLESSSPEDFVQAARSALSGEQ